MSFANYPKALCKPDVVKEALPPNHLLFKCFKMKLGNLFIRLNYFMPSASRQLPAILVPGEEKHFLTVIAMIAQSPCEPQLSLPFAVVLGPSTIHPSTTVASHTRDTWSTTCLFALCLKISPLRTRPGHLYWDTLYPVHSLWGLSSSSGPIG